jgi:AcrR family transcriptional regulator
VRSARGTCAGCGCGATASFARCSRATRTTLPAAAGRAGSTSTEASRRRDYGFDRASLRAIAAEAGVDQKLIAHFFGSKQERRRARVTDRGDGEARSRRTWGMTGALKVRDTIEVVLDVPLPSD